MVVSEMHINSNNGRFTHKYLSQSLKFRPGKLSCIYYLKYIKISVLDIKKFKGRDMLVHGRLIMSQCSSPTIEC